MAERQRAGCLKHRAFNQSGMFVTVKMHFFSHVLMTRSFCIFVFLEIQVDSVVTMANRMRNNGILRNYNIRERTKVIYKFHPNEKNIQNLIFV